MMTSSDDAKPGNRDGDAREPVREVVEESQEAIHVLEQRGLALEERLEQEREVLDEGDEVELAEKRWRKRTDEALDAIHEAVDALTVPEEPRRREVEVPEAPSAAPEPPAGEPEEDAEEDAEEERGEPGSTLEPLTEEQREALAEHVEGEILTATPIYRARRGQVVEVTYQAPGRVERTLLTVVGEEVRDLDRVGERVDALQPQAKVEPPEPEEEVALEEEPEAADDEAEAAPEEPAGEEEEGKPGLGSRVRGLFKRGKDEEGTGEDAAEGKEPQGTEDEEAEDPGGPAPSSEEGTTDEDGGGEERGSALDRVKGIFRRGGGDDLEEEKMAPEDDDVEEPEGHPAEEGPTDEDGSAAESPKGKGSLGQRVRGLFGRGDEEEDAMDDEDVEAEEPPYVEEEEERGVPPETEDDPKDLKERIKGIFDRGDDEDEG